MPYTRGKTDTASALSAARNEFVRAAASPSRPYNVIVIITDGASNNKNVSWFFLVVFYRASLVPSLGDWRRAQQLTHFRLLKRAQICKIHYIKWAYKATNVSHLISKIRKVMRPWFLLIFAHEFYVFIVRQVPQVSLHKSVVGFPIQTVIHVFWKLDLPWVGSQGQDLTRVGSSLQMMLDTFC